MSSVDHLGSLRGRLKRSRARREKKRRRGGKAPDFAGWTVEQVLVWAARHDRYEEIVTEANHGRRPALVALPPPEAAPAESPITSTPPESPEAVPNAAADAEPQPKAYWEEKCRWRLRGPDDYDWDTAQAGYQCIHGYDPLERP